jgi:hypothetical protein
LAVESRRYFLFQEDLGQVVEQTGAKVGIFFTESLDGVKLFVGRRVIIFHNPGLSTNYVKNLWKRLGMSQKI